MGNNADTEEVNKQSHARKKDTGHSLQQEECDGVSSETDMLSKPYLFFMFRMKPLHLMVGACISL